jgi:uncharacterized membrane protein YphA (DoxX/SURF4 family)
MFIAYIIVAVVMAFFAVGSGVAKLQHNPRVVAGVNGVVGVPIPWFPVLAACEIAGALGILIGIFWPPLGLAAAVGLVVYFVGAIIAHLRVRDFKGLGSPVVPLALAVATLVLRILSLH